MELQKPRGLFADEAKRAFEEFVFRPEFPCVGAKAAFHGGSHTVVTYGELASEEATTALSTDLSQFAQAIGRTKAHGSHAIDYATFVAIFEQPLAADEVEFERLFWQQLRRLHRQDAARFEWDPSVSSEPTDPHFSFSFGGQALYVIGLHANSSREARQFHWPALVFNPHEQFERLRDDGKWQRMQETIRTRDMALQGTINPMLSDFGEKSEARQYSGRAVDEDWRAPFPSMEKKCPFAH